MVSSSRRGRGRPRKNTSQEEEEEEENGGVGEYEESRAQRMKENLERMKRLGLFDLSKNLISLSAKPHRKFKPKPPSNHPPRRSSRLKELPPVSYSQKKKTPKEQQKKKSVSVLLVATEQETSEEIVEIHIGEGQNPEIYTEEHEKLLGHSDSVWELYVDGVDEDGSRIYDTLLAKSCHQCRQKTLGLRTECSKCNSGAGQLCGDCLYTRYGENVMEVNQNPEWVCPACRGICNCSRCRRDKGWVPTGSIYESVAKLGFKSVAHYLIHTRGRKANEMSAADNLSSAGGSLSVDEGKEKLTDALSLPMLDVDEKIERKDDMKVDSDEEYRGDDYGDDRW